MGLRSGAEDYCGGSLIGMGFWDNYDISATV